MADPWAQPREDELRRQQSGQPLMGQGFPLMPPPAAESAFDLSMMQMHLPPPPPLGGMPWGAPEASLMRDQMNMQMAALYQQQQHLQMRQAQPLAPSGSALLAMLHPELQAPPPTGRDPWANAPMAPPSQPVMHQQQQRQLRHPSPGPRRSPSPVNPNGWDRDARAMGRRSPSRETSGNAVSSVQVAPAVTKPSENIKVQVSLLVEECVPGRMLMVGLFRLGQNSNDKPIFVKQVLFENKLNRKFRSLQTRITFRAPRSAGEFEFRVFEELKRKDPTKEAAAPIYSNATIAKSNKLKVCMEYAHFIELLRGARDKFQSGREQQDASVVLSSLLSLLRLVDQIEVVFLHGHAVFGDLVTDCLDLVAMDEQSIAAAFPPSESIPSPIETFHGTVRNLLNGLEANEFALQLLSLEHVQQLHRFQRELYCSVSGFYFQSQEARAVFWRYHFGADAVALNDPEKARALLQSAFVTQRVTQWIESEAERLIPDKATFQRTRQGIYDLVYDHVIAKLSLKADLDVFGSCANGFGTDESDMDLCLVLDAPTSMQDKQHLLRQVLDLLEQRPDLFSDVDSSRLTARIPIVKFTMRESGIECDLCVENVLAQRNTALLRAYAEADDRVRVLAYVLKRFVKQRRMNCAAEGTLSSYGYLLMLLHFLQRQDPPVVPVLQTLGPNWQGVSKCDCTPSRLWCALGSAQCCLSERKDDMQLPSVLCSGPSDEDSSVRTRVETYFFDPLAFRDAAEKRALLQNFGRRNTSSVGELLVQFFEYYGLRFDASREVVSVRMARDLLKDEKKRSHQWRMHTRLSIEDPFEIGYDVGHVLKGSRDKYIRQEFVRAFALVASAAEKSEREADVEELMREMNAEVIDAPFLQSTGNR